MKFKVITFGCKVNAYESEYMTEQLKKNTYIETDKEEEAELFIVNTCSVTNVADNKCKKMIRSIKREHPDSILLVCGCSAENKREEYLSLGVDILIGNRDKSKIISLLENFIQERKQYSKFYEERVSFFEDMKINEFPLTRAFVKIQDGCNNYCAYCIIPYVRGSIRSKSLEEAVEEVTELVKKGHKEIVFTGINTGAFGKEKGTYDLVDLIQKVSVLDNLVRIRISSIEMTEITDRFIEELKNNKKICGHLHVSLQSGSETVLKRMGRKYTKEEYKRRVEQIRAARPDINFTTDVIVGFPLETEEEFNESMEYCKEIGFSKIHVFPYSVREGTRAATMEGQLSNAVKKERARKLIEVSEELQRKYHKQFMDKEIEVLIEENIENKSIGHTENFIKVEIPHVLEINKEYKVRITKVHTEYVEAILVNE